MMGLENTGTAAASCRAGQPPGPGSALTCSLVEHPDGGRGSTSHASGRRWNEKTAGTLYRIEISDGAKALAR